MGCTIYGTVLQIPEQNDQYTTKGVGRDFGMQLGHIENNSKCTLYFKSINIAMCVIFVRTLYPPEAVRQVVLAVDCLVAGGDVAEVAGLLHAVGRREGFEGKQAVVAVHLRWYVCHKKIRFF